jgi:hypothetical protein
VFWLQKDPRLSLAHLSICAVGKFLIAGAQMHAPGVFLIASAQEVDSPGVRIVVAMVGRAHLILGA